MERCYRCGRIKCETCYGTGSIQIDHQDGPKCPDCKDGWRDAERMGVTDKCQFPAWLVGEDEAILCPTSAKEAA